MKAGDKIKNVGGYLQKMVFTTNLVGTAGKKLQEEKEAKQKRFTLSTPKRQGKKMENITVFKHFKGSKEILQSDR
jgi:hypothetical protein